MNLILKYSTLAVLLSSGLAMANDRIESLYTSPECGDVDSKVEVGATEGKISPESLRLFFNNFGLQQDTAGFSQRNCHITATINVPAGRQFRAVEAVIEGVYQTASDATGGVELFYDLDATGAEGFWDFSFSADESSDFVGNAEVEDDRYTECSHKDQTVVLSSDIRLWLNHKKNNGPSFIDIDEEAKKYDLSWNWQFQDCANSNNYFNKTFDSYYKAYNGRNISAEMKLSGSTGWYKTNSGLEGNFYNVSYENGGTTAEGRWQANGQDGWFKFKIVDKKSGRFDGEWGDDSGAKGSWWGTYQ